MSRVLAQRLFWALVAPQPPVPAGNPSGQVSVLFPVDTVVACP